MANLTDVFDSDDDALRRLWNESTPAEDHSRVVPKGKYVADVIDGQLVESRNGTRGFRLTFRVSEGDFSRSGPKTTNRIKRRPAAGPKRLDLQSVPPSHVTVFTAVGGFVEAHHVTIH